VTASLQGRVALGPRAGEPVRLDAIKARELEGGRLREELAHLDAPFGQAD
jgi:hypothetical protein